MKWFKSSFSEASGNACVEVAICDDTRIALRDSKSPAAQTSVTGTAFRSFVNAVRRETLARTT
ncbi:DUF397 domain-containing protein [Streptomyces griseoviridis]|uniref:DUF397 domain-containing protein n=1 Tax=Streptomyces griseoviridis TaxID=45398 RepID=UPI00247607D8|nr:DUF397 domain-containing protein [Streptomyces sp. MAA16]